MQVLGVVAVLDRATNAVDIADATNIPFRPFAGVMGVAPDTDEMLDTGPPRRSGLIS